VSQRGDVIAPPLPGGNVAFGGVMGQGKSNAARVVMAGAALDPLAELWMFVFANNGDFDAYRPRLAHYHRGVDDTVVVAALDSLRALYEEVGRREARLADLGAKKVSRPLAEKHPDLRPVVALFSECHELFGHGEHGKEAADLAVQTMRRARKTAISLAFDTQSSRADAIPPKIVELVKINACFAVKSWRSNDGFLGDGSFQAGIRATELRMGKDVGTSVLTGATDERFEIVKWFYIEVDDDTGYDAAADIIARAVSAVHPAVKTLTGAAEQDEESRDLLADLGSVLGNERVPAADVPALLRDLAPNWLPYRRLNGYGRCLKSSTASRFRRPVIGTRSTPRLSAHGLPSATG
jgi:S-DNA-T family DNA segregation ATPase FtsK/SpoIIIE